MGRKTEVVFDILIQINIQKEIQIAKLKFVLNVIQFMKYIPNKGENMINTIILIFQDMGKVKRDVLNAARKIMKKLFLPGIGGIGQLFQ